MNHDNTNQGAIWKNERKEKDTHPDFTGNLNVDGVEYWVSAWKRAPGANPRAPSLKFSIKAKEAKPKQESGFRETQADYTGRGLGGAMSDNTDEPTYTDDDIPF